MTRPVLLLAGLVCWTAGAARAASVWEVTNEIGPYAEKRGLSTCRRSAVCGLVQANAWGISSQPNCDCPGQQACPLVWDPEDGHSVTHGSDQYKYCQRAPALPACSPGQLAMTDELVTYRDEASLSEHHQLLHCRCPASHQLQRTDSQWRETADADVILTENSCLQMPLCKPGQHCKFVTRSPSADLVKVNCACAGRQTCPTVTDRGVETQQYGRGAVLSIFCR